MRPLILALLLAACKAGPIDNKSDAPLSDDTDSTADDTDSTGDDTDNTADDTDSTADDTDTEVADDTDSPVDTDVPAGPDADADGSPDALDCADADPNIFPGAPELCNGGRDDDCDAATTDQGSATFFPTSGPPVSLTAALTSGAATTTQGDGEIALCAGTFSGTLDINGAQVTVRGAGASFTIWNIPTTWAAGIRAMYAGGSLTVRGVTFAGNRGIYAGNTIRTLNVEDSVFRGSIYEAIQVAHLDATITGCTFEDSSGSVVFSQWIQGDWGSLVVRDTVLRRITGGYALAGYPGTDVLLEDVTAEEIGGIYAGGDTVLRRFRTTNARGGISFTGRSALVEDSTFINNGGIASSTPAPTIVRDSTFADCGAVIGVGQGGLLMERVTVVRSGMTSATGDSPPVTIRDSEFSQMINTAVSVSCLQPTGGTNQITGTTFRDASQRGIAHNCNDTHLDLTGSEFRNLSNTNALGGVVRATVTGGLFEGNVSTGAGSAIMVGEDVVLRGATIRDNTSTSGAVYGGSQASHTVLEDCVFEGNEATSGYGAVDTQGRVTIVGSSFINNHGPSHGAVHTYSGTSRIEDSVFLRNGTVGGGIVFGAVLELENATFGDGTDENGQYDVYLWTSAMTRDLDGLYTGTCDVSGCF
jgi:hypothetical protein